METVYVLKQTTTNAYKIGITKDLNYTVNQMRNHSAYIVEIIANIQSDNPIELLTELHEKYKLNRIEQDFFLLTKEQEHELINYGKNLINNTVQKVKEFICLSENNHKLILLFLTNYANKKLRSIHKIDNEIEILNCIKKNYTGSFFTCSELKEKLMNEFDINIPVQTLGLFLTKKYFKKMKKIAGACHQVYFENQPL